MTTSTSVGIGGEPDLAAYFRSIEEPFRKTVASLREADIYDNLFDLLGLIVFFSVIPVIPYLLYRLVPRYVGGVTVHGMKLPLQSFAFWYIAAVATSIGLMFLVSTVGMGPKQRKAAAWLPAPEMRFALCYSVVDELERYERNGLPDCIHNALRSWRWLVNSIPAILGLGSDPFREGIGFEFPTPGIMHWNWSPDTLFSDVNRLAKNSWFKLGPETELILTAFKQLPSKVSERLRDQRDLALVSASVKHLAGYLYSLIPGVSDKKQGPHVLEFGRNQLVAFARDVESLSTYSSQQPIPKATPAFTTRIRSGIHSAISLLSHESPSVRYLAWWCSIQALVFLGVRIASHWKSGLWAEPAIIVMVIGTPLLVAAQMAGSSRRERR